MFRDNLNLPPLYFPYNTERLRGECRTHEGIVSLGKRLKERGRSMGHTDRPSQFYSFTGGQVETIDFKGPVTG